MREDEVRGRPLMGLDIGLSLGELQPLLRRQVTGTAVPHETVEVAAVNRRGRPIQVRVTVSAFQQSPEERSGAVMLMDPSDA